MKFILAVIALALAGVYWVSGFGSANERIVNRSPDAVYEALASFNPAGMQGAPGSDPTASGGVRSMFVTQRTETGYDYIVKSGDQIATTMHATITPTEDGNTKVTASVTRGDSPDDFTSPLFRSEKMTLAMFQLALEDELNKLTLPRRASEDECRELMEKWNQELNADGPAFGPRPDMGGRMSDTAKIGIRLAAMEAELRRHGCDTSGNRPFRHGKQELQMAPE